MIKILMDKYLSIETIYQQNDCVWNSLTAKSFRKNYMCTNIQHNVQQLTNIQQKSTTEDLY